VSDRETWSLPLLYGAAPHTPRRMAMVHEEPPLGPDDLPIETARTDEDQALASQLFPRAYTLQGPDGEREPVAVSSGARDEPELKGRPFVLRAVAGRLLELIGPNDPGGSVRLSGRPPTQS